MDNASLVRSKLDVSLNIGGGLKGLVKATAENVMLLLDTSGSMECRVDMREPKRRIDALREVVTQVKGTGTVPMIAFGGPYDAEVRFVDVIPEPDGGTPLHAAIPYAKTYGATRLVVISDGCPDVRDMCLDEARRFGGQIDVVFVGQAGDPGSEFLDQLARASGGKRFEGSLADVKAITGAVIGFLSGDVEPARAPIQGAGFTAETSEPVEEEDVEDEDDDDEDA